MDPEKKKKKKNLGHLSKLESSPNTGSENRKRPKPWVLCLWPHSPGDAQVGG